MENTISTLPATYPPATPRKPLGALESRPLSPIRTVAATDADRAKGRAARIEQRREWQAIDSNPTTRLRQQWADAAWMRAHLRAAGVSVADDREPASVKRLRKKLAQAGVTVTEAHEAIGMTLCKYLRVNTRLPLWAALALIVEATGRFTARARAGLSRNEGQQ